MKEILKTERLFLREMTQEDFPDLCEILQDSHVMYAYEGAFSDQEVQEWLEKQLTRYREDNIGLWAAVDRETNEMVGQVGLTWQDAAGQRVLEVGYLLKYRFWHKGYAAEAAKGCMDYAFQQMNADKVYSIIRDSNTASQKVALHNGMKPGITFVKHYRGIDMPHIVFSISKEEFYQKE